MFRVFVSLYLSILLISCETSTVNPVNPEINLEDSNSGIDFDGNLYSTVQIGNQLWIAENLRTTHFLNGDEIYEAKSTEDWFKYFKNKKPCYKKYGTNFIYNGYVVMDKRGLLKGNFSIPSLNDFSRLRDKLGKNADVKLASYEWEDWSNGDIETEPDTKTIKGNNKSGFNAMKSKSIYAPFMEGDPRNSSEKIIELKNDIPAWFWTKSKGSCIDCFGYQGDCLKSAMIGNLISFTCDEPNEGSVNYAYGLQIRMVKTISSETKQKSRNSNSTNYNSMIGFYVESKGDEFFEKLDGIEGVAHWIEGQIIFNVNGKQVSFNVFQDTDEAFKARKIRPFWSNKPRILETGAHGISYDFTNKENVGKKYKIYFKIDSNNNLIIKDYQEVNE